MSRRGFLLDVSRLATTSPSQLISRSSLTSIEFLPAVHTSRNLKLHFVRSLAVSQAEARAEIASEHLLLLDRS